MPLARRLDLLDWADRHEAFIVEDDFDSEYRYRGTPLPAMMGLDQAGRVIYLGSFSKVFSPALRLGYLVLPPSLTPKLHGRCLRRAVRWPPPWPSRHLRGSWRQAVLPPTSGACAVSTPPASRPWSRRSSTHLAGLLEVEPEAGGMHLDSTPVATPLAQRMSDVQLSDLARPNGLSLKPLSSFCHGPSRMQGVLMGYSGFDEAELDAACRKLASLLQA
jgi:GntR family transcriptional regulator/MocR family aminotransferase